MDIVLYQFLVEVPLAAAIWSVLLVVALGVLTALVARPQRDRPAVDPAPPAVDPVIEEATDLRRYAEEVGVAAVGAARTARRRREAWLAAQDALDRAWQAYDEAEAAARRFSGAGALPAPRTPEPRRVRRPGALAAPRRDGRPPARRAVHPAALRRLRAPGRLEPRLHPAQQEVVLARAVRDGRQAGHRAAVARERAAWRDAELAAEAARTLAVEAYAAAERARPVRSPTPRAATAAAGRIVPAARWRPARAG